MRTLAFLASAVLLCAVAAAVEPGHQWTGFRGTGDSHTRARDLPLSWSDRHNLAWKRSLPGFGQSTPLVWHQHIILTAVEGPKKEKLLVLVLDLKSGDEVWRRTFDSSRPQEAGERVARAAPTPVVDSSGIFALFDSGDLFALDHQGKLIWSKDFNKEFGRIENGHDFGSSLRQSEDRLYAFVNHVGPSYLVSLSKKDGALKWRRDFGKEGGWNTPLLVRWNQQDLLLIQRQGGVAAYEAKTGELLWEDLRGFSRDSAIPSLSVSGDIAVIPSQAKGGTWALRLQNPKTPLWTAKMANNAYSSPLLTAKRAYFVNSVGVLFCVDLESGRDLWSTRLPATTWASALAAGDRLYFFTGDGNTVVFRDSDTMEKLAENFLEADSTVYAATPVDGALLIRSGKTIWKVANLGQSDPDPSQARRPPVSAAKTISLPDPPPVSPGRPGEIRRNPRDGLDYVWIAPGSFDMGCSPQDSECEADEKPTHPVKISKGFWMGKTEVTVGAYRKFTQATGLPLPPEPTSSAMSLNPGWKNELLPMVRVSWEEASLYCRWAGGRLPTEAEWEYAARAGSRAPRYGALDQIAWYADNAGKSALDSERLAREQRGSYLVTLRDNGNTFHAVAQKKPNDFGLFDMLGNVFEWTADWYDVYTAAAALDPKGPPDGERRVARGGSWTMFPSKVRVSSRLRLAADAKNDFVGFRCVQPAP
ncbi:MAG: SUMF1/EgtB/PvdO family nonheme iron enzyme [Bryobacteraceae bacterium]|nr:SUMF1/EgtB/PvdO family nonheme iron enzyme [Bryobacteraceae bacterium]MDW8377967.1 SUMF1/EgtB/PvdO family nonheme iron enzyme [Bryobacterales bacterium]